MHREFDLQRHQITAKSECYYTFFYKEVHNLLLKGGVLDDMFHINNSGNHLSIIAELGNQPADVDVVRNLIRHREPGCHLAQIYLMTKTEMSRDQGSYGPLADSMSHHLLDLRLEASEPIENAHPRRQHYRNGSCRVHKPGVPQGPASTPGLGPGK